VGVGDTVGDAVGVPVGVPVVPTVGDEMLDTVAITSVKKAARSADTMHGGTPGGPWKATVTRTILLRSADLFAVETGKTANPSEVVFADTLTVLPSGQRTVAVPLAG
jgi:hypothetical protein